MRIIGFTDFERRHHQLISRRRFAVRMLKSILVWIALTGVGLAIGMAGYAGFEHMSLADSYANAAMILSGMGPIRRAENDGWKGVCRLLCNLLRSCNRHRNRSGIGAYLPSRTTSVSHGERRQKLIPRQGAATPQAMSTV